MPINANLLNALARPVRSVQDYQDDYTRQDIAQQGLQRNALLMQEAQAVQQDRERTRMDGDTLRNALQALPPGATYEQRISAMEGTNLPTGYTQADALRQALMKQRQGAATAGKLEQETEAGATKLQFERDDRWRKLVQAAEDPQHAMDLVVGAARQKLLSEPDAMQFIGRLSQDPAKFAQQKAAALAPALAAKELLPRQGVNNSGGFDNFYSQDPLTGAVTVNSKTARQQSPESVASNATQVRGQNLTDARARDFNAVQVEGNNIKRTEVQQGKDLTKNSQLASFDTMLGTLDRLANHPGLSKSVGIPGAFPTMPGSNSANFQAELNTFQSQAFLPMVAQLKGMGALSDAEGKKLTAAVGALDTKMGEKAIRESIGRITEEMNAARDRVSGTGGAPKPPAKSGPAVGAIEGGHRFKGGNPADPKNWEKQ